jgi:hypothetical protein
MRNDTKVETDVEVQLLALLTSTVNGGKWSASHTGSFAPEKRASIALEAGWSPRTGLGAVENKKRILFLAGVKHWFFGRPQ